MIRGLLAVWISTCLCLFAQACLDEERDHHLRAWFRKLIWGAMAGVTLLVIGGWCLTQYYGDIATRTKRDDYEQIVEALRQSMIDEMREEERLVTLLSAWPTIPPALVNRTPQTIEPANSALDFFSQKVPGSVFYLMDLRGLTIASSNRHLPDSFVNQSYAFRPYFQQAIQGAAGNYYALGVTSKKMGHYASFPVRDHAGIIVGVAVIKTTLEEIETLIHENYLALIIDQRGIVVMSNRSDMVLRSLWPLAETVKEALIASRQFGDGPFTPILDQKPTNGGEYLLQGKHMMVLHRPAPWKDWSIVIFGSVWPIAQSRLLGISITLLFSLAFIGFLTIIVIMREGEERFRQLFENAADSLILHDRGRVIEVNQQTCRSLGYTREELLRMSLLDIEVGYSKEFLRNRWEKEGDLITLSGLHRRKDGATFPAEVLVSEVTLRGQKLRLAAIRDITERKQAEEALQAERQRLYNLLDRLQAYIYLVRQDHSLVYVNQYFRERFGDPANRLCYEALHGCQAPCEACQSEKVFKTGTPQEWEWTSRSGRTYQLYDYPFADVDGTPLVLEMGIDITQHKRAEAALRTSEEALRQSQERYRMLAGHLLTAQEAERKRLARELHDDLSQRLAALAMDAETLERQTSFQSAADHLRLKEMKDKLVELSIDVHAMSRRLHPSILDDLGLVDAVASECAMFRKRDGIVVNYQVENISREVPPNVAVCLYRIVQEALRNISRHAGATEVAISLVGENQAIRLSIRDNGKGFDPGQKTSQAGLGLDSMEERAYLIGGDFSAKSQPGQGTVIEVLAPLSRRVV